MDVRQGASAVVEVVDDGVEVPVHEVGGGTLDLLAQNNNLIIPTGGRLVPTRAAKNIVPRISDLQWLSVQSTEGAFRRVVVPDDYRLSKVRNPATYAAGLTDFIYIELPGRGTGGSPLRKKFLVNPDSISVQYDVKDSESMARGGWMVGVWGEVGTVSVSGWTAGRYFAQRLVDTYSIYSPSHRDLLDLVAVYENNGIFFEGEDADSSSVNLSVARTQIQCHANVTFKFGNFVWDGYFTDLKLDDEAPRPFVTRFTLNFQILAERYTSESPWGGSIQPGTKFRGHAWEVYQEAIKIRTAARLALQAPASRDAAARGQSNLAGLSLIRPRK